MHVSARWKMHFLYFSFFSTPLSCLEGGEKLIIMRCVSKLSEMSWDINSGSITKITDRRSASSSSFWNNVHFAISTLCAEEARECSPHVIWVLERDEWKKYAWKLPSVHLDDRTTRGWVEWMAHIMQKSTENSDSCERPNAVVVSCVMTSPKHIIQPSSALCMEKDETN